VAAAGGEPAEVRCRRGIGTAAIKAERAEEQWKAGGPRHVFARIKKDNAASIAAFERAGFNRWKDAGDFWIYEVNSDAP